jgi:hypothetical protein
VSAIAPPVLIEPPQIERSTGGLYSVAPPQPGPVVQGSDRRWENGIEYQSDICAETQTWAITCGTDPERADKTFDQTFNMVGGTPFVSYLGVQCMLPGRSLEQYEASVRNALDLCEQRSIERAFWTGDLGNDPHLANGVYDAVTNPDGVHILGGSDVTALSLVGGISELESWLGDSYCGTGVLHAPRTIAPYAAQAYQIEGSNPRLTTVLGTHWAFGAGYSVNTGPDGTEAADGTAWIYATGQVNIWRSPIWIQPGALEQAFNRLTNDVELVAERAFVITRECSLAAVRVNLDCDC